MQLKPNTPITTLPLLGLGLAIALTVSSCVSSPLSKPSPSASGQDEKPELLTMNELRARIQGRVDPDGIVQLPSGDSIEAAAAQNPDSTDGAPDAEAPEAPDLPAVPDTVVQEPESEDNAAAEEEPGPKRGQSRWIRGVENPAIVNISFLDDPLADVLTLFSEYAGISILSSDEEDVTSKTITGDIQDQPWPVALETILRAHGLRAVQDEETGIIVVQTEGRALLQRDPEIIRLRYVYAEDILPTLETIVTSGSDNASDVINPVNTGSEKSNTLMIYTSPEKMEKIRDMVEQIDRKRPTVSIEAKLVFVNRSSIERMGFTYQIQSSNSNSGSDGSTDESTSETDDTGAPVATMRQLNQSYGNGTNGFQNPMQNQDATFSLMQEISLGGGVNLNVFFDVLQGTGLAEVQAAPLIVTTSDLEAQIEVGEFFILPNSQPVFTAASGGYAPMGGAYGGAGNYGGYPQAGGQYPQAGGQYPQAGGQYPQTGGQYPRTGGQYPQSGGYNQGGYNQGGYNQGGSGQSGGWGNFQTGTTLRVTPYVLPNGRVRMNLDIAREGGTLAPDGQTITGGRQSTTTEVVVHNNESIVIGGLTVVEKSRSEVGIPILRSLPVLGALFRTTKEAELYQDLVIVVTPHVIYDEDDDLYADETNTASEAKKNVRRH